MENMNLKGTYLFRCTDKNGNEKWTTELNNLITTVGINDLLNTYMDATGTTSGAWYMGLIDNVGYTAVANADTMSSHAGWTENTKYDEAARLTTAFDAANARSKALSAELQFTINDNVVIKGAFLCSNATKGGTTGVLFSAAGFTGGETRTAAASDIIYVTYLIGG